MKRINTLLTFLFAGLSNLQAQTIKQTIRGAVADLSLLQSIKSVRIVIDNGSLFCDTIDENGQFHCTTRI